MEQLPTRRAESATAPESVSRALYGGRLAEYLTGLKLDDPALVERLIEDQKAIRAKYGLPHLSLRFDDPGEYERVLRERAAKIGVRIDQKSECGSFFTEHPDALGVYFGHDNRLATTIDRSDYDAYTSSLDILAHELIHALQEIEAPRMPVEQREYEAYIAEADVDYFAEIEKRTERIIQLNNFFHKVIGASVDAWYDRKSEVDGAAAEPVWNNPNYFAAQDAARTEHPSPAGDTAAL